MNRFIAYSSCRCQVLLVLLFVVSDQKVLAEESRPIVGIDLRGYNIQDFFIEFGYVQGSDGFNALQELQTVRKETLERFIDWLNIRNLESDEFFVHCALTLEAMADAEIEGETTETIRRFRTTVAQRICRLRIARESVWLIRRKPKFPFMPPMPGEYYQSIYQDIQHSQAVCWALDRAIAAWVLKCSRK